LKRRLISSLTVPVEDVTWSMIAEAVAEDLGLLHVVGSSGGRSDPGAFRSRTSPRGHAGRRVHAVVARRGTPARVVDEGERNGEALALAPERSGSGSPLLAEIHELDSSFVGAVPRGRSPEQVEDLATFSFG